MPTIRVFLGTIAEGHTEMEVDAIPRIGESIITSVDSEWRKVTNVVHRIDQNFVAIFTNTREE